MDINDLTIVLANYGYSTCGSGAGLAAVPEPDALAMLGACLAGLLGCGLAETRLRKTNEGCVGCVERTRAAADGAFHATHRADCIRLSVLA